MTASRPLLSILDLAPRSEGMSPADALEASLRLAVRADELGYARYWMAEHHSSETFMSSATSLLLARLAEHTARIRLGSGGVMLPNHAPLMVAEYYGTLATIYGDRFDLGLGRAPGTDPQTARALRRGAADLPDFAADVADLARYLGHLGEPGARDLGDERRSLSLLDRNYVPTGAVRALPGEGTRVPLWMLGSSLGGASVAAALGLPFSFASHFAPAQLEEALAHYRAHFNADAPTAQIDRPRVMAGVTVLVAPTQDEAAYLFTTSQRLQAGLRSGRPAPLQPPVHDLSDVLDERTYRLVSRPGGVTAVGAPDKVAETLANFAARYDLDEIITASYVYDPALRVRSYELLADAWGLGW
ncbi:MAG: LLM class flavin-dependent oxidoreductase [Bowdeniella nasicola]|nr:LLM class flavin-dependent oxidoreductase [Bowdeniella nasicola]